MRARTPAVSIPASHSACQLQGDVPLSCSCWVTDIRGVRLRRGLLCRRVGVRVLRVDVVKRRVRQQGNCRKASRRVEMEMRRACPAIGRCEDEDEDPVWAPRHWSMPRRRYLPTLGCPLGQKRSAWRARRDGKCVPLRSIVHLASVSETSFSVQLQRFNFSPLLSFPLASGARCTQSQLHIKLLCLSLSSSLLVPPLSNATECHPFSNSLTHTTQRHFPSLPPQHPARRHALPR